MSESPEPKVFTGGRTLMLAAAIAGVLGTGLTVLGFTTNPTLAASSALLAFTYWAGLAMASLLLLAGFNAAGARWFTLVRRQLEHHASALVVCALAFIPVALTGKHLYPWMTSIEKHAWLNERGFVTRGAVVLVLFALVWFLLDRRSRLQAQKPPDEALRRRARVLSAAALPLLALATTIAAIDWLMSLEPHWASSIFGVYWFAGAALSATALLLLAVIVPIDRTLPAARASGRHVARLAVLLLVCTGVWAWAGYSQQFIVLQAGLPDETPWLAARGGAWAPVATLLVIGRFALPVLPLLSSELRRHRKFLTAVGVWTLTMQFVDLFWIIKPALRLHSEALALPEAAFGWTDLTAWVGLGGLCVAFVLLRMRGNHAVPVNDPALEDSLQWRS